MMKRIYILAVALVLALMPAAAQDVSKQESRKAKLQREIELLDQQLAQNASKSSALLSNLELLKKNIENRKALVKESDKEIRRYADSVYLKQLAINRLKARVDTLTSHYSRLVKSAYKNRDARVWYMYMLASDNLGQAFRRFGYFKNLSNQMKNEAQQIRTIKEELELERVRLADMKKEAEVVKAERVKELDELKKDEAKVDKVVKQLNKDKKKYQQQLASKKKEVDALNREIERIVAAAMKSTTSKSSSNKTVVDTKLDEEFSKNKGKLPWPADGPVVDRFGKHYHPVYKNLQLPPNNGFDIALGKDTKIRAVFDGVVKQVMVMPGYNQCVMIQHGNYFTLYCKMKSIAVKEGDKVKTSDIIGTIDTINGQTQLHFELWKGSKPQNPEQWLK